jgi:hypothetical protein
MFVLALIIAVAGYVTLTKGTSVLALRRSVQAGQTITYTELESISLPDSVKVPAIGTGAAGVVEGKVAATELVAGQILAATDVTTEAKLPAGETYVGMTLNSNQFPPSVAYGDHVVIVEAGTNLTTATTTSSSPPVATSTTPSSPSSTTATKPPAVVLAPDATIAAINYPSSGTSGTGVISDTRGATSTSGSSTGALFTLEVTAADAPAVATAAAADDIAIVQMSAATVKPATTTTTVPAS